MSAAKETFRDDYWAERISDVFACARLSGNHTGYDTLPAPYPVLPVSTITHRQDVVCSPTTSVGIPPMEDFHTGAASANLYLLIFNEPLAGRAPRA